MLVSMILAAGASTRFAGIKQLAIINHKTMLNLAIERFCAVTNSRCLVVLGANASKIKPSLPQEVNTTLVNKWQHGMSASIEHGLQACVNLYGTRLSHVLIGLADQVAIDARYIEKLKLTHEAHPQKIIATKYDNTVGVPAIFPVSFLPALLALQGDSGAKSVIQKFQDQVIVVDNPLAKLDIDTQQDLDQWRANIQRHDDK